jgi:hypothetical protein
LVLIVFLITDHKTDSCPLSISLYPPLHLSLVPTPHGPLGHRSLGPSSHLTGRACPSSQPEATHLPHQPFLPSSPNVEATDHRSPPSSPDELGADLFLPCCHSMTMTLSSPGACAGVAVRTGSNGEEWLATRSSWPHFRREASFSLRFFGLCLSYYGCVNVYLWLLCEHLVHL